MMATVIDTDNMSDDPGASDIYVPAPAPNRFADALDNAALAVIGVLSVLIMTGGAVPLKELVLLAFIFYVPGRAVTAHVPSLNGPTLALVTTAGSVSLATLLATVALWLRWWQPTRLFSAEAVVCAVSLACALYLRSRRRLSFSEGNDRVPTVRPRWRLAHSDVLLPAALALWGWGVSTVQVGRIDQWGLLPALPVCFYAGLGVLMLSIVLLLAWKDLSDTRLALHLVALVVMIAGTTAVVYPVPRYAWLYKHIGVVGYINLHGSLNQSVDIYQNWPGFFALVAWFDRVAGAVSPLGFAGWTETIVMLATCVALYAAAQQLHLSRFERWVGLLFFVVASWVDEVYFSPQALGYFLSIAVLALVVCWCRDDRSYRWMEVIGRPLRPAARRISGRPIGSTVAEASGQHPISQVTVRAGAIVAILGIYAVLVLVHQLSPYVVALQVTVLVVFGRVRPRWLAPVLWLMAIAYLLPKLGYVNKNYGLLNSLGNFFSNVQTGATQAQRPYELGIRYSGHATAAISLVIWLLAAVGVVRRFRAGRPVILLAGLAFAPVIMFFVTNYGGEALYRVYFFSIPWIALLAASALSPGARQRSFRHNIFTGLALAALVLLLLPAYWGDDSIYFMPAGEITAAEYFYNHAPAGSALILAGPGFPSRESGRYDLYPISQNEVDTNLDEYPKLWEFHEIGGQSLPVLADIMQTFVGREGHAAYLVFSSSEFAAVLGYNLAPPGALENLESAVEHSPQWSVFFRNTSTTIFEFHPEGVEKA